ncbi:MAG TPA: amphi-Trp domain-containing protein [Nannocystis sp.]|jgi:amphi-Trp domain-containing protein
MKFARNDLKVEGAASVAHVAAYLEQLAQALRAGTAHVRQGDQQIVLGPSDVVGFSLAASDRGKRQSVSLELTWRKRNIPATELDLHFGSEAPATESTEATEVGTSPGLEDEASVLTGVPGTDTDASKGEAHEGEKL